MKLRRLDPLPLGSPKPQALLDRRDAERASIGCKVIYTDTEGARIVRIKGTLQDISKTGCKILGKTQPVLGCDLTLLLYLEDGTAPLSLPPPHLPPPPPPPP